jgi:hypothetical protein
MAAKDTVTVGCKLPNGLVLRLYRSEEVTVPVSGGGIAKEKRARQVGGDVQLNGFASVFGEAPKALVIGGYAMTPNVDSAFFEEWLKQNKGSDLIENKLVFAHKTEASAKDQAKDQAKVHSGLEPLSPNVDKRIPRSSKKNLTSVETAEA